MMSGVIKLVISGKVSICKQVKVIVYMLEGKFDSSTREQKYNCGDRNPKCLTIDKLFEVVGDAL